MDLRLARPSDSTSNPQNAEEILRRADDDKSDHGIRDHPVGCSGVEALIAYIRTISGAALPRRGCLVADTGACVTENEKKLTINLPKMSTSSQ